jgi:hypothetical protein
MGFSSAVSIYFGIGDGDGTTTPLGVVLSFQERLYRPPQKSTRNGVLVPSRFSMIGDDGETTAPTGVVVPGILTLTPPTTLTKCTCIVLGCNG